MLHRDVDDVQAAQSYLQKPLSHMREPGVFEKHKQVLQDSAIQGDRFSTSTDALTNMMEMKRNKRSLRWVTLAQLLFLVHHQLCLHGAAISLQRRRQASV